MNGFTERLCRSLSAIPEQEVLAHGAQLIHHVLSRFPKPTQDDFPSWSAAPPAGLAATDFSTRCRSVDMAAFNNVFRFAMDQCRQERSQEDVNLESVCWSVPVFAAAALAEAQGKSYQDLCHAVGLGIGVYSRLLASLASSTTRKGFDPHVLAATMAAIVACGAIENLPPHKLAQAIGLGCSAITAVTPGYLPLQAATAARDGIVMVLLITHGFGAPPDALACRWGLYETFADPADMSSLDLGSDRAMVDDGLLRVFGASTDEDHMLHNLSGSILVHTLMTDVFRSRETSHQTGGSR